MMASEPPNLSQTVAQKEEIKVETKAGTASSSKPKPPFDPLPWIYWLLFFLLVPGAAFWMAHKPAQINLPVLKQEVSAYHVITANDISMKSFDQNKMMNNTVTKTQDLLGHYTLVAIQGDQPLQQNQIGPKPDLSLISNVLAVDVPANSVTILGGKLHAGDVVSVAARPLSNPALPFTNVFDKVLVLDIKSVAGQPDIVLAIPADRWPDYVAKTRNAIIVLARHIN